jgi:uncharacterized membrane protein
MNKKQPETIPVPEKNLHDVELLISRCLRFGVLLSAGVILIGLLIFLLRGQSGYPGGTYPTRFTDIMKGVAEFKPFAIIMTGLLLLILTPVLRVGASLLAFLKEKDWLYAGISLTVFLILIVGFLLGRAG